MTNTGEPQVRLEGHAYRPTKSWNGRRVIPGCECGEPLLTHGIDTVTARNIHRDHKKRAIKALKAAE